MLCKICGFDNIEVTEAQKIRTFPISLPHTKNKKKVDNVTTYSINK